MTSTQHSKSPERHMLSRLSFVTALCMTCRSIKQPAPSTSILLSRSKHRQLKTSNNLEAGKSTRHRDTTTTTPIMADFTTLSKHLLSSMTLVKAPSTPKDKSTTSKIADLQLHPTLEATLHILNRDLPSAHFLVRHMQAAPALEGMLLHGILHRCEGDFRNASLWISDVGDACEGFKPKKKDEGERLDDEVAEQCRCPGIDKDLVSFVYGEQSVDGAKKLIDDVEGFRRRKGGESEEGRLSERIRGEMGRVLEWCEKKFGTGSYTDASSAWVKNSEEVQKISNDMVSGGKGYRDF
jgi:hypothetical protein